MRPPIDAVREAVRRALQEDLTALGDLTSALLDPTTQATADFVARESGVLAGVDCAAEAFAQLDTSITVDWQAGDGDEIDVKQVLGRVRGPLHAVLTGERTALNFLCHLSGIATSTKRFVQAAGGKVRILDTRKTTPGLRALEKAAVRAGGGANHRGSLSDWVMFKDNHLAVLGIEEAVRRARERWPARTVHVECESLEQVRSALIAGADALLLDNMTPADVRVCVAEAAGHPTEHGRPLLEVSGGITLETIKEYAATGVDVISIGALTNSSPNLDIGLDIVAGATGDR